MPKDSFGSSADSLMAPASNCFAIIPDDATDLVEVTKALYVGTGGDVVLRAVDAAGDTTFRNLQDGSTLDVRVSAVRATGTTAGDMVGLS